MFVITEEPVERTVLELVHTLPLVGVAAPMAISRQVALRGSCIAWDEHSACFVNEICGLFT